MKFVSAQQDNKYCIWQVYVQLANFRRLGIEQDAIVLFGYEGAPSPFIEQLRRQTSATVIAYPDMRENKVYTPSIYFHLVSRFVHDYKPTESLFLHDGDIVFRELPLFHKMLNDDTCYFSDTSNYLSPALYDPSDFEMMANAIGSDVDRVIITQTVGGAQHLFKRNDATWWKMVEYRSQKLNTLMTSDAFRNKRREKKMPDPWMAGMWALQWSCWDWGYATDVHPELNFTWPTYTADTWNVTKILHNAGVMPGHADRMFHKGSYVERSPFGDDLSHVSRDFASFHYAKEVIAAGRMFQPGF